MILAHATWKEVQDFNRESVVLIPTGSLEQHGPHLPLFTDSLLATAVASEVERRLPSKVLLVPTLWLGASGHHLAFPGSLSASFESYEGAIIDVVESLVPHQFTKFYVLNGHGGNTEPNGVAMRKLKRKHPNLTFGHLGYFAFVADKAANLLKGPTKEMRHACEAEVSLMMHLHPDMVRTDRLRDDGLSSNPAVRGVIHHFDEVSEEGSLGYATHATAETGKALFEVAVEGACREIETIADGYVLEAR
ncbi:MAG TPA: creatininase family protein [Fimbriimonadaceae bacterium]|nr:creatininase family protein [Fimbriimonadaceae bacterium]